VGEDGQLLGSQPCLYCTYNVLQTASKPTCDSCHKAAMLQVRRRLTASVTPLSSLELQVALACVAQDAVNIEISIISAAI
jgi:hypothetical protein